MDEIELNERLERLEREIDALHVQVRERAGLPAEGLPFEMIRRELRFRMICREFHELIGEPLTLN